jgi:hypothetical protein
MTMNPLPPQAYTKDTLTKAYLWLLHQNDSIKELATTPDVLVTLFLKAQRNGDDSLDTPSIQNFKNELKSLAGMMGELERPPSATGGSTVFRSTTAMPPFSSASEPPPPAPTAPKKTPAGASAFSHPSFPHGAPPMAAQNPTQQTTSHQSQPPSSPPPTPSQASADVVAQLDGKSRAMVAEVREELNLGSDVEVLRLLISLGYKKARNLYT